MSFNYRVMAIPHPNKGWQVVELMINDIYYGGDGEPRSFGAIGDGRWGETVHGENIADLLDVLRRMREALDKPILCGGDRWPDIYTPQ